MVDSPQVSTEESPDEYGYAPTSDAPPDDLSYWEQWQEDAAEAAGDAGRLLGGLFAWGADTAAGVAETAGEVAEGTLGAIGDVVEKSATGSTNVIDAAGNALEDAASAAAKPFAIALGVIGVAAVAAYATAKR